MTSGKLQKKKRRIQTQVSDHVGSRMDRLAEVYRTTLIPGASIATIKASVALRAVIHVGLDAEEKRLGLPPLSEEKASPERVTASAALRRKRRKNAS